MAWSSPKTWNVGDVLTAADMNTYVRDNAGYLHGDAGTVDLAAVSLRFGTGGIMRGHRHPYGADRHIENGRLVAIANSTSVSFTDAFGAAPAVVISYEDATADTSQNGGSGAPPNGIAAALSVGTTGFTAITGQGGTRNLYWIADGAD